MSSLLFHILIINFWLFISCNSTEFSAISANKNKKKSAVETEEVQVNVGADKAIEVENDNNNDKTIEVENNDAAENYIDKSVAKPDSIETFIERPTVINVLENDEGVTAKTKVLKVTQGLHGAVTIVEESRTVEYTPEKGFIGADEFLYTVSSNSRAKVTVLVYPNCDKICAEWDPDKKVFTVRTGTIYDTLTAKCPGCTGQGTYAFCDDLCQASWVCACGNCFGTLPEACASSWSCDSACPLGGTVTNDSGMFCRENTSFSRTRTWKCKY